ncbi:MAG: gliding motility-associated ABC transporter ATP-binding subunit GldA [Prevotellaceae bacterium]|jgi:ABC-2 type transport system ATP-binding protein|nr:gliding motility-associated ABC transporter ATP-binding subunit GldA [Prevotellaceae bacterium]
MSISVKKISKYYGQQCVLNEVSFEIGSGQIVGFIGPNGAGKSTMMKIITGFVPYETGSVEICGLEVKDNPLETKRLIGYLPEHNPLYLEMYVKEYLRFVGQMYGLGKSTNARVDEMIERVGLTLEYKKRIGQLSKGYRQRVGLAQALIHDPKVLILDEPTTGLDPNQLVDVRTLISEIGREKTVMLSTHIMQEVSAICDRVVIINRGNIVADEQEAEIVSAKTTENPVFIVEFEQDLDETIFREIKSVIFVEKEKPRFYRIESADDIRGEIFRFAAEKGFTLLSMNRRERNMEDVFHELTGKK